MAKQKKAPPPRRAPTLIREALLTAAALLLLGGFSLTGMGRHMWRRTADIYAAMPAQARTTKAEKRFDQSFSVNYNLPAYVMGVLRQQRSPLLVLPPRNYVWEQGDPSMKPTQYLWPEPLVWCYFFGPTQVVSYRHPMAQKATHTVMYNPANHQLSVIEFQAPEHRRQVLQLFADTDARYPAAPDPLNER
jgi:hypothetical protein